MILGTDDSWYRKEFDIFDSKSHLEIAKTDHLVVDLLHKSESWQRSFTIPKVIYVLKI